MSCEKSFGFREHEHTADCELEVWAEDLPTLFEQAGRGMYAIASVDLQEGPRLEYAFSLEAADIESLLVAFLNELLYLIEEKNLAFDVFAIEIEGSSLRARLNGAPIASIRKEIKAATYHNLAIKTGQDGRLQVIIVFDL